MKQRLALLGLGKMGSILLQAFLKTRLLSPGSVLATVRHPERAQVLDSELPFPVATDNRSAAKVSAVVLICVKPQSIREVCEDIRSEMGPEKMVLSIAASVPTRSIERFLSVGVPVIRAMPNTPCAVASGMTALCGGTHARPDHLQTAKRLFDAVGRTVVVDEKHMDAVTGLSASGPAYMYVILESLAEAGVKLGLPRDVATELAAQTALGSAREVLETGSHPALLKDEVTTPAGCTIDGILELEEGKLRVTLIKAVVKAAGRARELYVEEE
ncbi:MAG: pyrroline-5-carboxylate reductase [Acidobacteriota bacterium]